MYSCEYKSFNIKPLYDNNHYGNTDLIYHGWRTFKDIDMDAAFRHFTLPHIIMTASVVIFFVMKNLANATTFDRNCKYTYLLYYGCRMNTQKCCGIQLKVVAFLM